MQIGFGILLDDESYNYARKIELELCNKFDLCWGLKQPPHVTIKAPFKTNNIKPFEDYLGSLAKKIKPFYIDLESFDYFSSNVIFLDVKENKKLLNLHLNIINDLKEDFGIKPNAFEGKNRRFHSTVALEDVTEEKFKKAKKYLQGKNPKFRFKIKTIGLFYYLGKSGGWVVTKKVDLK